MRVLDIKNNKYVCVIAWRDEERGSKATRDRAVCMIYTLPVIMTCVPLWIRNHLRHGLSRPTPKYFVSRPDQ